jgi:hypothetical protein
VTRLPSRITPRRSLSPSSDVSPPETAAEDEPTPPRCLPAWSDVPDAWPPRAHPSREPPCPPRGSGTSPRPDKPGQWREAVRRVRDLVPNTAPRWQAAWWPSAPVRPDERTGVTRRRPRSVDFRTDPIRRSAAIDRLSDITRCRTPRIDHAGTLQYTELGQSHRD